MLPIKITYFFSFFFFHFIKSDLSSFSLNFEDTSSYKGYFVRKITNTKVYIGNLYQEMTYDINTKTSDNYYIPSLCGEGTSCPLIMMENSIPTYSVSKKGETYQVVNLSNNNTQSNTFGYNQMGIYQLSSEEAVIGAKTSSDSIFSAARRDFLKINVNDIYSIDPNSDYFNVSQTYELGYILLNDEYILTFSQYSTDLFYYLYLDKSFNQMNDDWVSVTTTKNYGYYGYHQIVELYGLKLLICTLTGDKTSVECLSGSYNLSAFSFSILYPIKPILTDCPTSNSHESFSLYKLTEQVAIVGCGTSTFQFKKITSSLTQEGESFKLTSPDYVFIDFTVLDSNRLYFILAASTSTGANSYYGDLFSFPYCRSKSETIILSSNEIFLIKKLFTESSEPSLTSLTKQMKITNFNDTNNIQDTNSGVIMINDVYYIDDLYFISSSSYLVSYSYKGVTAVFENYDYLYETSECSFTILVCNEFCMTCSQPSNGNIQNCDSCDNNNGYFRSEDSSTNCYNSTNLPGPNYFLDRESKLYRQCYSNCATCNELGDNDDNKCTSCITDYYPIEGKESNCIHKDTIIEGYVFYEGEQIFKECYQTCKTCSGPFIGDTQNCLTCKEGFKQHPFIESNCILNCDTKWYIGNNYEYFCLGLNEEGIEKNCDEFYPLLIEDTKQCVSSCHDYYTCELCKEKELYEYNGKCIEQCPNGISYNDKCVQVLNEKSKPNITNNVAEYKMDSDLEAESFKEIINQAIDIGFQSSEENDEDVLTTIKGDSFTFDFYPSDINSTIVKSRGSPKINLGECEDILRDTYQIPKDEELYISQIVYDNVSDTSATNQIQYEIYRESTKKSIDLSPCNEVKVSITQPILNANNLNLVLGEELAKDGINIYDPEDQIFNDRCTSLSIGGKDVSMKDRREHVYTNATFCSDGCSLKSLNLSINEIECECDAQTEGFVSLLEENEIFSTFSSLVTSTNIEMFRCYKLIPDIRFNFVPNYANWIMIPIIIGLIVLSIIFIFSQMKMIYSNLNKHLPFSPPLKEIGKEIDDIESLQIYNEIDQDRNNPIRTLPYSSSSNNLVYKGEGYVSTNCISEEKPRSQIEEETSKEEEVDINELNEMDYRDALKNDHRSFCRYFLNIITEKQIILSTILNRSVFYPISLRLILLFFTISSFFFLNGMLFTEEYITERYNTTETLDVWYVLKNELSKSVYSSLIGMFIAKFISMLLSSESSFIKLSKEKGDIYYYQNFRSLISDMKKKYFLVIFIVIVASITYWYFLFIFCEVYKSNQLSWIQSSLFSILFDIILPIAICFAIAIIRIIALRGKLSLLFNISHCLYQIV